jgi:hypothetical protein
VVLQHGTERESYGLDVMFLHWKLGPQDGSIGTFKRKGLLGGLQIQGAMALKGIKVVLMGFWLVLIKIVI